MKSVILKAPGQFEIAEVPMPNAESGDVIIRIEAAAICGTDLRILSGRKRKGVRFPSVIGHEFAGEVVASDGAFAVGDRIAVDPVIPCRRCFYCRTGKENICLNRQAIGYEFDGAFAEYLRIPAAALEAGNALKLPDSMTFAEGALVEPLACCLNGQKNAGVGLGDTVLILGAGPIGIMHLLLARAAGASLTIVSEPNAGRRSQAADFGADLVVDPETEDPGEAVRARTGGLGADVAILAIGIPKLVADAPNWVRKGGRVNLFAGFSIGDSSPLDVNLLHYNELLVSGASALSRRDYEQAMKMIASGRIDIGRLVTHRFPLHEFAEAVRMAASGNALKVVLENVWTEDNAGAPGY
jgi:L-iditol 2-dehydrogenase